MKWIGFFTDLDGRIGRKTFWLATLTVLVVELAAMFVAAMVAAAMTGDESLAADWPLDIVMLVFNYPQFIINAKRGHDRNIATWVPAVFFVYSIALDALAALGWPRESLARDPLAFAAYIPYGVLGLALLIELGFRKGKPGANRYGPDPLAAQMPTVLG